MNRAFAPGKFALLLGLSLNLAVAPSCGPRLRRPEMTDERQIEVAAELRRRVTVDFRQMEVRDVIDRIFSGPHLSLNRRVFVDAVPRVRVDIKMEDATVEDVLNEIAKKANVEWSIRTEFVYVGTKEQIERINRITDALEGVKSEILQKALSRKISICAPQPLPYEDIIRICESRGISVVSRFRIPDEMPQRFGAFDFEQGIKMRNLLCFIAANWNLEFQVEGDSIVFSLQEKP